MSNRVRRADVPNPQRGEDETAVTSLPIETDDGRTVVIQQQNAGPGNQVGGGEFKNTDGPPSVDEAALRQLELEQSAPIEPDSD